jgi:hypothetical protein
MMLKALFMLTTCLVMGKLLNRVDPAHKWDECFAHCSDTVH